MSVDDKKQIKNRLAVFEQVSCKGKKIVVKNSYKHFLNRSLSPTSDVIDEDDYNISQPQKKRSKGVRMEDEPLHLLCVWNRCHFIFTDFHEYMKHVGEHVKDVEENFICMWNYCEYNTTSSFLFKQHVVFHGYHTRLKNVGDNVIKRQDLPVCVHSYEFTIPEEVNGYTCDWIDCGTHFCTVYEFFSHLKLHVNSNPKYCKDGEIISCCWKGCSCKFNTQYKLADHLRTHSKEKVVACSTCGNMFATKTKFYDHRKRQLPIENIEQSYQCSQCSKLFPSERLLRDHTRSHINHYKCTMCDMTCPKPSALATHIRFRHLNERSFKCSRCDLTCMSKQSLSAHLITHSHVKLYSCELCDFRCRSMYGLDKHDQVVHGQGWTPIYECHCCGKTFSRGNNLTQHFLKDHKFQRPSGHSRYRYKEDTDGIFRLQTVRYESIEVTQEMINKPAQSTSKKRQQICDKIPNYVLMIAENGEQNVAYPTENNIVITINDVDEKGNVVNSEIVEANEMKVMDANKSTSEVAQTNEMKVMDSDKSTSEVVQANEIKVIEANKSTSDERCLRPRKK